MGYLHIDNLYKNQYILQHRECYAMEKIHGTSAHISYANGRVALFAGGADYKVFAAIFDQEALQKSLDALNIPNSIYVYGEAYGGKMQGMSKRGYGDTLKFVAFDVKIGDVWLNVPKAEDFVCSLGLDFVPYVKCGTDVEVLDAERDRPSEQAKKLGEGIHPREGIVLRPLEEVLTNNGERVIAKHKGSEFSETKTLREISPDKLRIIAEARAIAEEWVTEERLNHILTSGAVEEQIENTGKVITLMVEDVIREAQGEIVDSKEARKEISKCTALMFKNRLEDTLHE